MVKRLAEKNPRVLMELGRRLDKARKTLSPEAYDAFKRKEREMYHETKHEILVNDKDVRLIAISRSPVLNKYIDNLPWTGWGTLRELLKLGEGILENLLIRGAINRFSTREDIDQFRTAQKPPDSGGVADRHP